MPRENPSLVTRRPCGCMVSAVVEKPNTYDLVAKFYKRAAQDKAVVERIMPKDEFEWECEQHRTERLNRKKQSTLFAGETNAMVSTRGGTNREGGEKEDQA